MKTKIDMKNSNYRSLYFAADIRRRVLNLQHKWTDFDPYGAATYELRDMADNAWAMFDTIAESVDFDFTTAKHPIGRIVAYGTHGYGRFAAEVKGIEGALRRLMREPYAKNLPVVVCLEGNIRNNLKELKAQGAF